MTEFALSSKIWMSMSESAYLWSFLFLSKNKPTRIAARTDPPIKMPMPALRPVDIELFSSVLILMIMSLFGTKVFEFEKKIELENISDWLNISDFVKIFDSEK